MSGKVAAAFLAISLGVVIASYLLTTRFPCFAAALLKRRALYQEDLADAQSVKHFTSVPATRPSVAVWAHAALDAGIEKAQDKWLRHRDWLITDWVALDVVEA